MSSAIDVATLSLDQTPFQHALQKYLDSLDPRTKTKDFFVNCYEQICDNPREMDPNDASQINRILQGKVEKNLKISSTAGRIMQTLVGLQEKYDGFVNKLVAFDPTPISKAVWTCIGVLAKAVDSYFKIPEKIGEALVALGDDLKSIETYNRLFRSSPALEDVFCESYLDIFCFWNRVFQELVRNKPRRLLASLGGTDKFDSNISDMRRNTERVKEMVKVAERTQAFEEKQKEKVRSFLGQSMLVTSQTSFENYVPHSQQAILEKQCCEWIFQQKKYQDWLHGETAFGTLWVHGPPGSGKSTLCRNVAQSIEEAGPSAAVASHYFSFDQNFTTLEVLKSLAAQLWDHWVAYYPSPTLLDKLASLAEAGEAGRQSFEQLSTILHELTSALPIVYFFVDGVDEEVAKGVEGQSAHSLKNSLGVLDEMDALVRSTSTSSGTVRLWISSQEIPWTQKKFEAYLPFNIKDVVKGGIHHYLTQTVNDLTVISEARRRSILQELIMRTESNFLWARLMIIELRKAKTEGDMDEALETGRTKDLDDYFNNFFHRRLKEEDIALSRDVFSLVTFARSPLKVGELQEAVSALWSIKGQRKDPKKYTIFLSSLLEAIYPLIEVRDVQWPSTSVDAHHIVDSMTEDSPGPPILRKSCRLFHSTLFDFLQRQSCLFYEDNEETPYNEHGSPKFTVSQLRIAESCLLYLAQPPFARPFTRLASSWVDMNNKPALDHQFLLYSARNWDKHLDLVSLDGSDFPSTHAVEEALPIVKARFGGVVQNFLASANYGTCLQTLSLWDRATFYPSRQGDNKLIYIRQRLPRWCGYKMDYHRFWREWSGLLGENEGLNILELRREFLRHSGEIERCWWGSLGPDNILSTLPSRYISYRFQTMIARGGSGDDKRGPELQAVHATPHGVHILWRTSALSDDMFTFTVEVWRYGDNKLPVLRTSRSLSISKVACRAGFFAIPRQDGSKRYDLSGENSRAPLAAFSDDGYCLRIGTQLYVLNSVDEFDVFPGIAACREAYIEEHAGNSTIVVITNRGSPPVDFVCGPLEQRFGAPRIAQHGVGIITSDFNELIAREEGSDQGDDGDDEGWESWSECSSLAHHDQEQEAHVGSDLSSETSSEQEYQRDIDIESGDSQDSNGSEAEASENMSEAGSKLELGDHHNNDKSSDSNNDDESEVAEVTGTNEGGSMEKDSEQINPSGVESSDDDDDDDDDGSPLLSFSQIYHRSAYGLGFDSDDESTGYHTFDGDSGSTSTENDQAPNSAELASDDSSLTDMEQASPRASAVRVDQSLQWAIASVRRLQASLRIFTSTGRTFSFIAPLGYSSGLSNSPPILHPTRPLVVWPLEEWCVLYVDYDNSTYFTRELGTASERASRSPDDVNLLTKCHFTSDGKYLHIALFTGRRMYGGIQIHISPNPTLVTVTLYTYKLCSRQPTRAPPTLLHSQTTTLDAFDKSRLTPRFPWTLHWTDSYLYVTCSSPTLNVCRFSLLRDNIDEMLSKAESTEVHYLKEPIPLPASAAGRNVFFFPSGDSCSARVILGPLLINRTFDRVSGDAASPFGCNLNVNEDLGGWTTRHTATVDKSSEDHSTTVDEPSENHSDWIGVFDEGPPVQDPEIQGSYIAELLCETPSQHSEYVGVPWGAPWDDGTPPKVEVIFPEQFRRWTMEDGKLKQV